MTRMYLISVTAMTEAVWAVNTPVIRHADKVADVPCACPGRRRSLGMACALTLLFGLSSALSPSFWWLFVLRCLSGAAAAGVAQAAFLLGTEPVGPSWRAPVILAMGELLLRPFPGS